MSASSVTWLAGGAELVGVSGRSVACLGSSNNSHRLPAPQTMVPRKAGEDQVTLEASDKVEALVTMHTGQC